MRSFPVSVVLCMLLLLALCTLVPDGQILWEAGDALYTGNALLSPTLSILPYGAGLAASACVAWVISCVLNRKNIEIHSMVRWFVWALALGIVCSRLLYCLVEPAYYNPKWMTRFAPLRIWDGGMAMTGALLGILLAGKRVPKAACLFPTAAPLFLVGARLSEMFTQLGCGPSVYFDGILTRQAGYSVRLNVSLLESMTALIIFLCMAYLPRYASRKKLVLTGKAHVCAFLILYGVSQIFMESLRKDRHMIWGFTKAQQIFAILLILSALMILAADKTKKRRAFLTTLCAAAPLVGLEFALDRADVSIFLLYGAYLLILAAYLFAACRIFHQSLSQAE